MTKLIIGRPAPPFTLPDLDGRPVALEKLRGEIVLVNFWSAECPWSARADQALVSWQDRVRVLAVASNANEPPALLRQAAGARGLETVLVDQNQAAAGLYDAQTTPHCFLVDREGILRYQGAFDDVTFRRRAPTRAYVIEAIEALLAGQQPPDVDTPPYGCTIVRTYSE